eukprot:9962124-Alexandrium_andersonii.AAC.1
MRPYTWLTRPRRVSRAAVGPSTRSQAIGCSPTPLQKAMPTWRLSASAACGALPRPTLPRTA